MAISQCGSQRLEARDVARQFEYSQDSQNPENLRSFRDVLERVGGGEEVEADADEEGEDAEQVDDVQEGGEEGELVRRHQQPHRVLQGEPAHEDGLRHAEEVILLLVRSLLQWKCYNVHHSTLGNCDYDGSVSTISTLSSVFI